MKIKAPSFADLFAENTPQLGGAKRTKFLQTLDRLIPWEALKALISPYYSSGKRGQQPYPLEIIPNSQNIAPGFFHFDKNLS